MAMMGKSEKVPKQMQPVYDAVVVLTDAFCKEYLNEEYRHLARRATAAMCRKRLTPLVKGDLTSWACGIIYALGFVNFLFDKNQKPYVSAADLCDRFGVSKSTGSARAKVVRDSLNMVQLDPNWCLPSMLDDNPLAWMITLNGFVMDVRTLPHEIQEVAYQKGLIPYIPADKRSNPE